MPAAIESFEQFKELINAEKPIIVDFWATWCGPCKMIAPHFNKLEKTYDNVDFYKVDIDDQEQIAAEVGIKNMPTFMIFQKGQKIDTVTGAVPAKLTAALKELPSKIPGLAEPTPAAA